MNTEDWKGNELVSDEELAEAGYFDDPDTGTLISCIVIMIGCALVAIMVVLVVSMVRAIPAPACCPPPPSQQGVLTPPPR